jgi:hypothetical protein
MAIAPSLKAHLDERILCTCEQKIKAFLDEMYATLRVVYTTKAVATLKVLTE